MVITYDEFMVGQIKDLLCMRKSPNHSIRSSDEIRAFREYLVAIQEGTYNCSM